MARNRQGGSLSIDLSELDAFVDQIAKAPEIVVNHLVRGVDRITSEVVRLAVRNIERNESVVTGNLRRSIARKPARRTGGGVTGSAGTAVEYARPVEFGRDGFEAAPGRVLAFVPRRAGPVMLGSPTLRGGVIFRPRVGPAAPRPFLRPAFRDVKPGAEKEFKAVITRIILDLQRAA